MKPALLGSLFLLLALAAPCAAQTERADSLESTGSSYWGTFPAESDSVRAVFGNRRTPGWRKALYLPFRVVLLPLWVVDRVGYFGVNTVYNAPAVRTAAAYAGYIPGPWGSRFRPTIQAGNLAGFGGGIALEHRSFFGPGNDLRLNAALTINGDLRFTSGALFRGEGGKELEIGIGVRNRPNAQFYGIGPNSLESNESHYRQQYGWIGGEFRSHLGGHFYFGSRANVTTSYADTTTLEKINPDERTQNVFPVELLPGFGSRSTGVGFGASLYFDNTFDRGRPGSGGIYRALGYFFTDIDNNHISYLDLRLDLQQFFSLWNSNQRLAVRTYCSWIESLGGDPVPFQRLMTNDDPDELRGFKDFRWRDLGMIAASFEYRWPVWVVSEPNGPGVDLYLLGDVGQVFGDAKEIAWDNLTVSYGFGLRAVTTPAFMGRIEVAWSDEGTVFRLVGSQDFQFSLGSLLRGREPIPPR